MGRVGHLGSDFSVITSDNPRSEDPDAIVAEIAEGTRRSAAPGAWRVEVDRRAAIRDTLASAAPGDVVLIAGKGHEQGQEFAGGHKLPFDDRLVAREELLALATTAGGPGGGSRAGVEGAVPDDARRAPRSTRGAK